jgi:hypothetical protein
MLYYANDNNDKGDSLELLVHHGDPHREYSYDKDVVKTLEEAEHQGEIS